MLKSVTYGCRSPMCQIFLALQRTNQRRYLYEWFASSVHKRNFFLLFHNCLFHLNTRNFVAEINEIDGDDKTFRLLDQKAQRGVLEKKNIHILAEVLQCTEKEAKSLIVNEHELFVENFDESIRKLKFLMSEGITSDAILKNIWVLYMSLCMLLII